MIGVLIRGRNCRKYLAKCLRSISRQTYSDWKILLILDAPTDGAEKDLSEITGVLGIEGKICWIVRDSRKGLSYNMYYGIRSLRDCDVIAIIDADDWVSKDAFETVMKAYKDPKILLTYGSYMKQSKKRRTRISHAYPESANVMKHGWRASHLKTIRGSLVKKISDTQFKHKDKWLPAASDVALMLPLMKRIGLKRTKHIHKIIYHWRDGTPYKTNRELQLKCEKIVRSR